MDPRVTRRTFTVAGALAIAGCVNPGPSDGGLVIHHIDVGQADATVVRTEEEETIVIDTGFYEQNGEAVISYLEDLGVDRIDHLVGTHPHSDHIGGHTEVITHFEEEKEGVGTIYDPGVPHTTWIYDEYIDTVEQFDKEIVTLNSGDQVPVAGETQALVLNPQNSNGDNLNNASVSLRLTSGGVGYITTGDAEFNAEQFMVSEWGTGLEADIYYVGHHGSSDASDEAFLDAISPDIGVISSAFDSIYGHPHDEVLMRLSEFDVETYWTGVHSTTLASVDEGITMEPDESFSTDPLDIMDEAPDSEEAASLADTLDIQNGQATLVVDRIEDGVAVLFHETTDGVAKSVTVSPALLPDETSEGSVLSATVEDSAVSDITVDRNATERRRQAAQDRMDRVSRSLDDE